MLELARHDDAQSVRWGRRSTRSSSSSPRPLSKAAELHLMGTVKQSMHAMMHAIMVKGGARVFADAQGYEGCAV